MTCVPCRTLANWGFFENLGLDPKFDGESEVSPLKHVWRYTQIFRKTHSDLIRTELTIVDDLIIIKIQFICCHGSSGRNFCEVGRLRMWAGAVAQLRKGDQCLQEECAGCMGGEA